MDYEQRYKKALELIKNCVPDENGLVHVHPGDIFSELRESEDEQIRKEIEQLIQCMHDADPRKERWIAWLEKQGEHKRFRDFIQIGDKVTRNEAGELVNLSQLARIAKPRRAKPVDNVESKFKVGDWVVNPYGDVWHIDSLDKKNYQVSNNGRYNYFPIAKQDEMHLWTFADAKEGDVLVNGSNIFIFHFINDTRLMGYCHVNTNDGKFYDDLGKNECFCLIDAVVNPATKFQRNILFTRMKEAGYEWNAEKKELKKIDTYCQNNCKGFQETGKCFADGDCEAKKNELKNKSYDDELLESAIAFIESSNTFCEWKGNSKKDVLEWINSLKHRVQQKQEWTEEDNNNMQFIDAVLFYDKDIPEDICMKLRNWLQSLKPHTDMVEALRTEYEKGRADTLSEMKSSWSEEDEKTLNEIFSVAARASLRKSTLFGKSYDYIKWQNWLKSLRDRVQPRPKYAWSIEDERVIAIINNALTESNTPPDAYDKVYDWLESIKQRIRIKL